MAKEKETNRAYEEFAKWVMDLAKFIFTGIVISPVFGGIEDKTVAIAFGTALAFVLLLVGLTILYKQTKQTKKRK